MPEPTVRFTVVDAPTQELAILIRGGDLGTERPEDSTGEPILDPVAAFVAAAQLHGFVAPSAEPWDSDAEIVGRSADPAAVEVSYHVRLRNVHCGAFRVLANLLMARLPELIQIETVKAAAHPVASLLDLASLEYPSPVGQTPFPVDHEMPIRSSRDRFLQIAFARPPQPDVLEVVYSGLATWVQLPLFGGYPQQEMKPWESSVDPSPAFLLDPNTVEQAFPDLFLCDDDCYAWVVNWARYLHRSVCPVAGIVLR